MRVRVPPRPLKAKTLKERQALAYIIGVALGDGNLSNPNGRAVRLRITCDTRYPKIQEEIIQKLKLLLPCNSILTIKRPRHCVDISVYSNSLASLLPWQVGSSKESQHACVPDWIFDNPLYVSECLRGLLQTDGSIYIDRGYLMINFTNNIQVLCEQVALMMNMLGFKPTYHQALNASGTKKYTVRLARNAKEFIKIIKLTKM